MAETVRQRLDEQSAGLVGRGNELAVLRQLLDEGGPVVVFVHGIAGTGKSALANAFAVEARAQGATVLRIDGRSIDPTEGGFLNALAGKNEIARIEVVAEQLGRVGDRMVVVVDTYEALRPIDSWLREAFVPSLPNSVRVVLFGRDAPLTDWPRTLGDLFRALHLENLQRKDALVLLARGGLDQEGAEGVYRYARGHPLSLRLAASAVAQRPRADRDDVAVTAIVEEFGELYLGDLDLETRAALDAASVVRRPSLSVLAAMLGDTAAQDASDRLRTLPFVEQSNDGLLLHDTVRAAVVAAFRSRDLTRYKRYRAAAYRQTWIDGVGASGREMWRHTANLFYLIENPILREAFFPTTDLAHSVDAALPEDEAAIAAISTRHELPATQAIVAAWWRLAPGAFRVVRDRRGSVAGFSILSDMERLSHRLVDLDPVVRSAWGHLRSDPVRDPQWAMISRLMLARDYDDVPSPVHAACWLDLMRTYLEEPEGNLRRVYIALRNRAAFDSAAAQLGFTLLSEHPVEFDGVSPFLAQYDLGPACDGWVHRLLVAEFPIVSDSILDLEQHQLVLDGRRVDLTPLEFALINYLEPRKGIAVARTELLQRVWEYTDAGGSNVIDATVRSLRKKLGDHAGSIETIRGFGYRFASPAYDWGDMTATREPPGHQGQ